MATCTYQFKKGKSAGELCGKKIGDGEMFCKKHNKEPTEKETETVVEKVSCTFILTRGMRKGMECGNKAVDEGGFCKKHGEKEEKPVKVSKKPLSAAILRSFTHNSGVNRYIDTNGFVLKNPEFDENGKSRNSGKVVIVGKIGKDNDVVDLDDDDLQSCSNLCYTYQKVIGKD